MEKIKSDKMLKRLWKLKKKLEQLNKRKEKKRNETKEVKFLYFDLWLGLARKYLELLLGEKSTNISCQP